ncbi:hypothetical protein A2U01_0025515 [Trifolium medium]|uniref:Uncharacterized protein n=1 Tax=Trifolium medium TaxID=97028 RepID=A0A392NXC8_9FABA|nr:hypothetical protein [Trifolium medium]
MHLGCRLNTQKPSPHCRCLLIHYQQTAAFHPHIQNSSQCSSGGGGAFPLMAAPPTNLIWGSWPPTPLRL